MRKPTNNKIYHAAVIAVVAETIIAVSLFLIPSLTVFEKLKIFGGLFIIIKAGLFFFISKDRLTEGRFLRYSIFLFPVMTSVFAGIALLISGVSSLSWLANICSFGLVLSILISAILLIYALKTKKVKRT